MQNYSIKEPVYFSTTRMDIVPLLPKFSKYILEVGCGEGVTLKWLKQNGYCEKTFGLELFEGMRTTAEQNVDELTIGDAENIIYNYNDKEFDLILCLDVLEHMVDPWKFINNLETKLKPGGIIIASIPNVRNANLLYKIIFKKSFEYTKNGLLDKTHLRFFAKKEAIALLNTKMLDIDRVIYNPVSIKSRIGLFNLITLGIFRELLTTQFLLRAIKK